MKKFFQKSAAALVVLALGFTGCSEDTYNVNNAFSSAPGPDVVKVLYQPGANIVEWTRVPTADSYGVYRQTVKKDADPAEFPWIKLNAGQEDNITTDGYVGIVDTHAVEANRQYRYKIVTSGVTNEQHGEKESDVGEAVTPALPATLPAVTQLSAVKQPNGKVKVSWTKIPNNNAVKYTVSGVSTYKNSVEVDAGGGNYTVTASLGTLQSSASIGLANIGFSAEAHQTSYTGTDPVYTVRLAWNPVPNASGYKISRAPIDSNGVVGAYSNPAAPSLATGTSGTSNVIIATDSPALRQGHSYKLFATVSGQDVEVGTAGINNGVYQSVQLNWNNSYIQDYGSWNPTTGYISNYRIRISKNQNDIMGYGYDGLRSGESIKVYRRPNSGTVTQWAEVSTTITSAIYNASGALGTNGVPNDTIDPGTDYWNYTYKLVFVGPAGPIPNSTLSLGN
jgi:hypothetical protein